MECKDALQSQLANCCCGINRNIVECKEELYNKGLVGTDGINRNIVECKVNTFSLEAHDIIVLIETLWNVKVDDNGTVQARLKPVLIETLWNVKTFESLS